MRLAGRRILITGAASGIGRVAAELFRREGAAMALLDRDEEQLRSVANQIGGTALEVDLRDDGAVRRAVDTAADALGGLDGVVNAAGVFMPRPFAETPLAQWRTTLDINLTGPFLVCQAALPWLQQQDRATIVNIASGQALVPSSGSASYGASKAGLAMLSKFMAQELAPRIRVNAIAPGMVETPMAATALAGVEPAQLAAALGAYAMKRMAQPIEIAHLLLYLTSDESSFITGDLIAIDGGRTYH